MSGKIGIAIIGCGGIAQAHLESLRRIDDFRIVATVDIIEEKAKKYASRYKAERYYTSTDEALEDPEIEAVSICLPHHLHSPVTVAAAKAGKHILVEKPMAISLKGADEMIKAADENGVTLMVEQTLRFRTCNILTKKLIGEGRIGEVRNVIRRRLSFSNSFPSEWSRRPEQSGGWVLYGFGSHSVDLVLWVLDADPVQVFAYGVKNNPYWNDYDEVSIMMKLDNGAVASVLHSLNYRQQYTWDLTVIGTKGSILVKEGKTVQIGDEILETPIDRTQGIYAALKEFAGAIKEGREPEASGRNVRRTMLALEAAKISMERKRAIDVKDLPDLL